MLRDRVLFLGQQLIEKGAWYFAPFSWVYAFIVFCRNRLYDWHWLPITRVKATVASVGNIVAGGSGKTPLVLLLAQRFAHRKVAILSRGYGQMPDEAMLLARRLPNAQVYVGKDRIALAQQAAADLILLDDGFQYRKLHRDFDIVLGDREGHYLPWGFLRDSPKRLQETEWVFKVKLSVKRILDRHLNEIPTIRGWKVVIFCGIAKPYQFKKTVEELGAEVVGEKIFADHEPADLGKLPKASAFICTEKDFVKLPPTDLPIYFLEMEAEITEGREKWEKLIKLIDRKLEPSRSNLHP